MKLTSEYTTKEIDEMRERIHEHEFDTLDLNDFKEILWHGCTGIENLDDTRIIEVYYELELED